MAKVEEVKDESGQTKILQLKHESGAECEIYMYGATLTKFKTAGGKDLIWVSSTAKLDGTKAIRGGIPLVFPHFGQPIKEMPQHGFARNNSWKLESTSSSGVCLCLDNTMATHEAWPFPYKLQFEVSIAANTLDTVLRVINTGADSFKFMSLQHTYLNVGDISATSVTGLGGQRFLDKAAADPTAMNVETRTTADIKEYTDRVYVNVNAQQGNGVTVSSASGEMTLKGTASLKLADGVEMQMPSDTVMWNPWADKAKGMGDCDDDGYLKMLCIEPGLISDFHMLPAGGSMSLRQVLSAL